MVRPYNSLTSFSAEVGSLHQHKARKDGDKKREKKLQNENKKEERKHLKRTIKRVPECLSSPRSPEIKKSTMLTPLLPSNPHAAGGPPPWRGNFKGEFFLLGVHLKFPGPWCWQMEEGCPKPGEEEEVTPPRYRWVMK